MTLSRTPRRKEAANWTPRSNPLKGLLLGRTPSPSPAHCARPGPRGILGHVVFGWGSGSPRLLLQVTFRPRDVVTLRFSRCRLFPLPFPLQKLSPRLPRTFYDVGSESASAPGPLFGKVTWTSTAMAEGEEVLPLPTSGGDGW